MSDLADRLEAKAALIEMGEKIAWGSEVALMREAAVALRACKGRDQADVARDVAEQIACAPWGTLWNHSTIPTLKERAEWKGRREAALEILGFLDPECAKSITAALEQEHRHE